MNKQDLELLKEAYETVTSNNAFTDEEKIWITSVAKEMATKVRKPIISVVTEVTLINFINVDRLVKKLLDMQPTIPQEFKFMYVSMFENGITDALTEIVLYPESKSVAFFERTRRIDIRDENLKKLFEDKIKKGIQTYIRYYTVTSSQMKRKEDFLAWREQQLNINKMTNKLPDLKGIF